MPNFNYGPLGIWLLASGLFMVLPSCESYVRAKATIVWDQTSPPEDVKTHISPVLIQRIEFSANRMEAAATVAEHWAREAETAARRAEEGAKKTEQAAGEVEAAVKKIEAIYSSAQKN